MKLTEWLNKQESYGMFSPPMDAQTAVRMIKDYLLGEDWYSPNPISTEQINAEIVYTILNKYSKQFRKEWRKYWRKKNDK